MDTKETIQNYIVQPVMLPILPTSGPSLDETFRIDPAYNAATQQLNVTMSFKIPGDYNASNVAIKQYYNPNDTSKLHFYAVYGSESTAELKRVDCTFKASAMDAAGNPIALGGILAITTMLVNTVGPKTSRGVMSSVRTTEQ